MFHSRLAQISKEARIATAKQLLELPDDLLPPQDRGGSKRTSLSLAPLYILATARLLDGSPDTIDEKVFRAVYNAFSQGIRFHRIQKGEACGVDLKSVVKSLERGLVNKSRSVRLAAG